MAGFDNDVVYGVNVDFSGQGGGLGGTATLVTNGQLLIGSTALNAGGTHINVGTITSPNSTVTIGYSSPNITIDLPGNKAAIQTLSDNSNTLVFPNGSGNIQLQGHVNSALGPFATTVAGANLMKLNPMSPARWIVDSLGFNGTHTTIASALSSASSGETILVLPGTYTENITLKAGVNICGLPTDGYNGNVIISGNATLSTAGTVNISGIQLQTNSAAFLTVSGSVASIVNLFDCNLNCTNATGISYSSSSASSKINIFDCIGDLGTTGIAFYSMSSAGTLTFNRCNFTNSGGSSTASSNSAGTVTFNYVVLLSPISTSSSGIIGGNYLNQSTSAQNATCVTTAGTGVSGFNYSRHASGTASAISIGAGTTVNFQGPIVDSTNTNAITGAGTYTIANPNFPNTSHQVNVTTQSAGGASYGLTQGTAPSAGFIGEQITSAVTTVSLANNTQANITSINLTAGIWDVSAICSVNGSVANVTDFSAGISTTTNTIIGNLGDSFGRFVPSAATTILTMTIPVKRATLSSTTTYYLVGLVLFGSGTVNGQGRITATRVG